MKHILLLIYIVSFGLFAQDQVFNLQNSHGELYEYAEYTNTGNSTYTIQQIAKNSILKYNRLESENHSVGFTSDDYWVRFKLENSSKNANTYYLETARPITDVVNLYQISNGETKRFKSGDQIGSNRISGR